MAEPKRPAGDVRTISQAAQASGVDRRTVRRRLDAGRFPGAFRAEPNETWYIPVADLEAAGMPADPAPRTEERGTRQRDTSLARWTPAPAAVRPGPEPDDVARWRERALVAEAAASERGQTIEALQLALRVVMDRNA